MQDEQPEAVKPYAAQQSAHLEKLRAAARQRKQTQREKEKLEMTPAADRYRKLAKRYNELGELRETAWCPEVEREMEQVGEALDSAQEDLWRHNLAALNPAERAVLDARQNAFDELVKGINKENAVQLVKEFEAQYPLPADREHSFYVRFGRILDSARFLCGLP